MGRGSQRVPFVGLFVPFITTYYQRGLSKTPPLKYVLLIHRQGELIIRTRWISFVIFKIHYLSLPLTKLYLPRKGRHYLYFNVES